MAVPSANRPPDAGGRVQPAGGQDAQQVPVRDDERVALGRGDASDDPVRTGADLVERLATGPRSAPDRPARVGLRMSGVSRPSRSP